MDTRAPESRTRWIVLSFAFAATVINYVDRQTLSVMAPMLLERYHISTESYSHIIFAFMLAYTISNGLAGRFLDRVGSRIGYGAIIAFWSAAEILHAVARSAFGFAGCRFLLGIGEAGNYPAGVKLISEHFPAEHRSTAGGIFNSGASIGAIIAPPLLAFMALRLGPGWSFILLGSLGFIWLIAWILFYRQSHSESRQAKSAMGFRELAGSRFLWQFTFSKVFSDPVWYFYTFWVPQYLHVNFHFTMRQIGATAWIPFFTAAIGNLAGGGLFTILWKRCNVSIAGARRISVVCFSALMTSALLIPWAISPAQALGLVSIATFGYSGALANLLVLPADVFPGDVTASVWGIASVGSGLGGMLFSLATGWLISRYSFESAFLMFGVLPIISGVLVWTLPKSSGLSIREPDFESH